MKTPKRVAIVAMGLSHADYVLGAAINNGLLPNVDEVWAINAMVGIIRCDRAFILDNLSLANRDEWVKENTLGAYDTYRRFLSNYNGIVYTNTPLDEFPSMVAYPLEDVINTLGFAYFNTTVAYTVAFALHLGVKEIFIYGADFSYPNRHAAESGRACTEFLLGYAIAKGVEVHLAQNTTLMDNNVGRPLYGLPNKVVAKDHENERFILVDKPTPTEVTANAVPS